MRFLMVANFPRVRELGAAQIQIELGAELRRQGHHVEELYCDDLFPKGGGNPLFNALRRTKSDFARSARRYLQKRINEFDVVDATEGAVACRLADLGFKGLQVTRSAGLTGLYAKILNDRFPQTSPPSLKTRAGNVVRGFGRWRDGNIDRRSFELPDLANIVNGEEEDFLRTEWKLSTPSVRIPYGLSGERLTMLRDAALSADDRLKRQTVVFVGTWQPRKGSQDAPALLHRIRDQLPEVRFLFLGTGATAPVIQAELGHRFEECLAVVPHYPIAELPELLAPCTVGMFPSYVESFGFAVLEKLASGLPTVAYRCPGPPVMLDHCDPSCLVTPGDTDAMADQIVRRLRFSPAEYQQESELCQKVAAKFNWREIARETITSYSAALREKRLSLKRGPVAALGSYS